MPSEEEKPEARAGEETSDAKSDKRLRQRVDALLAQSAIKATGSVQASGGAIDYTTVCEFIPVRAAGHEGPAADPEAAVFTTAYFKHGRPEDTAPRPLCFAFNGGPGSASIWLHLGALGPKRVVVPDDGRMPEPPYIVSDNPLTWLAHFDLVFIDPPHTGWSVAASTQARKRMLSVDGDVEALRDVIQGWLTRHRRWGSRLYLAGESYGTTRAAALADKLHEGGVALMGLVLVSCAMDLQSLCFEPRNDLPHALFLPAYANVAQFHGKLEGALGSTAETARAAAEAFVYEDYVRVLHAGARLGDSERRKVAHRLAELTGLSADLIERKNLRITDSVFFAELLRDRGRIVGRLDARGTAPMAASQSHEAEFDPGIEAIVAPYTMAAMAYFGGSLGLGEGLQAGQRYEVLSMDTHKQWNWNRGSGPDCPQGNSYASTSADLSRVLRRNPHLRILVASGRYDLGTPYSATDWSLAQLDVPSEVRERVEHRYYDAGHMMYTRQADLSRLEADLGAWLDVA